MLSSNHFKNQLLLFHYIALHFISAVDGIGMVVGNGSVSTVHSNIALLQYRISINLDMTTCV